jgi:oligosaccharide repeat unit polymerase
MDQHRILLVDNGPVEHASSIERPSRSGSVLLQLIFIGAAAVVLLAWAALFRPADAALLLGLMAITYINYLVGGRDVLYPAFTYTAIWLLVSLAYVFCPIEVYRIGWKTVAIFLAGAASFSIGSKLGNRSILTSRKADVKSLGIAPKEDNPQARNLLLGCTVLVTLIFLFLIVKIAGGISSISLQFLLTLNAPGSPLEDAGAFTTIIAGSGGLLPVLTLWVFLMEEKRKWMIVVCVVCVALFPLFVTQRGLVMTALCGCITLVLLRKRDRSFRKMAMPLGFAALGAVLLMTLMSLTKFWAHAPDGFSPTTGAWMYITGSFPAFDYAVYHPEAYEAQPAAVFAQVLTPLSRLHLIRYRTFLEETGSGLDKFVFVPFGANVYTAYKPYYEDFGAMGCFASFALFGFIEGYLFYRAIRGGSIAVFFLAHLSGALMFSTFDDSYHGFSRHLNVLIFAVGYFWVMKRIRVRL